MDEKKNNKKRIGRLQNTAIVFLSLLAVILFLYSFAPTVNADWPDLTALFSSRSQGSSLQEEGDCSTLSAPVQISVAGQHGRFGCVATFSDESLISLNTLMKEAFGSAGTAAAATEDAFRAALLKSGVYYDFTSSIPLPLLSSMLDTSTAAAPFQSVRRLLLASDADTVRLFCYDGIGYYVSSTAISPGTLETTIAAYEPNDTAFLFERSDFGHRLDPYTLITEDMLSRPGYVCSIPAMGGDNPQILEFLGFNSHSNSRYVESDGTEVIFGSDATLRLEPDGTVTYAGTRRDESVFSAEGSSGTAAVSAAYRIASGILSSGMGDAALYLDALETSENGYTVSFNYMADGIPIRFHDGSCAATVTVTEGVITAFTLRCRSYTRSDEAIRPLPLTQALAIAAEETGTLGISYVDNAANTLSVSWIVTQ